MNQIARAESTHYDPVRTHYESPEGNTDNMTRVLAMLDDMGKTITTAQIAALDQFHAKGLMGTKELAALSDFSTGMKVLDAGSGLGGPARYIAETYGCDVTGIDLTPSFVELATLLTERTGLSDKVHFQTGSITDLPFPDASFDRVWTQHVVMNIKDRASLYREFRRVLKPNGKLVFHDIYLADNKPELIYPLPWAATPETSFLLSKAETIAALEQAGFTIEQWVDDTEKTLAAFQAQMQAQQHMHDQLTLSTLIGPRMKELGANIVKNVQAGNVKVGMGICAAQ